MLLYEHRSWDTRRRQGLVCEMTWKFVAKDLELQKYPPIFLNHLWKDAWACSCSVFEVWRVFLTLGRFKCFWWPSFLDDLKFWLFVWWLKRSSGNHHWNPWWRRRWRIISLCLGNRKETKLISWTAWSIIEKISTYTYTYICIYIYEIIYKSIYIK